MSTLTNFTAEDFEEHAAGGGAPKTKPAPKPKAEKPEPVAPPEPEVDPEPEPVPEGTVNEIMAWVDGDAGRAQAALEAEYARDKPRTSLTDQLDDIIGDA